MKKRNFAFLSILLLLAVLLTSCLFESEDSALSSWLSDQGLPDSYNVQTLSVDNLVPVSAEVFLDTTPRSANERAVFGRVSNISHDLVMDFGFESGLLTTLKKADSAASLLYFRVIPSFYKTKEFPVDSFPIAEEMDVNVSWKLTRSKDEDFLKKIMTYNDSDWYRGIQEWEPDGSADTTVSISLGKKDSSLMIVLPSALVDDIRSEVSACRLQLRLSAPEAKHIYHIVGPSYAYGPQFRMTTLSDTTYIHRTVTPFRMANAISNKEDCGDCLVLHGGVLDSLVAEFPSEPILQKLSEFYGDPFPEDVGNGNDVRQAVVLAQMTFFRDDSEGYTELGHPIQVVVGSYVDSLGKESRKMESYKLNKELILDEGHPNMVFHDGDSLTLQVTYGLRDFINKARSDSKFKMMMRLGYPVLQEKDSTYANYITASGDTSRVFFSHFDYARYDFTQSMSKPATLKLWLASKRGDK